MLPAPAHSVRTVETPNAVMKTYASPSTDAPATVSVWRTEMRAGASGPLHTVDQDQVVVVVAGKLDALVGGQAVLVEPDYGLVLPAGALRRLRAEGDEDLVTVTASLPRAMATVHGSDDPVPVPWTQ